MVFRHIQVQSNGFRLYLEQRDCISKNIGPEIDTGTNQFFNLVYFFNKNSLIFKNSGNTEFWLVVSKFVLEKFLNIFRWPLWQKSPKFLSEGNGKIVKLERFKLENFELERSILCSREFVEVGKKMFSFEYINVFEKIEGNWKNFHILRNIQMKLKIFRTTRMPLLIT